MRGMRRVKIGGKVRRLEEEWEGERWGLRFIIQFFEFWALSLALLFCDFVNFSCYLQMFFSIVLVIFTDSTLFFIYHYCLMFLFIFMFFTILFMLLWSYDYYLTCDFILPFILYLHYFDFTFCVFTYLCDFNIVTLFAALQINFTLSYFMSVLIFTFINIFTFYYVFTCNRYIFNFYTSMWLFYRFLFYDIYFLFLFYFLFVFINMFGFYINDIFMLFIFLDFFGLFVDMLTFEFSYHSIHTLPLSCF